MNLFTILNANNYHTYNREVARKIGLESAIFLSEVIDKFTYFESKGDLKEEWFYLTIDAVEQRTTLTRRQQDTAIENLRKLGFLETKQMGMPAKRHFRIFKEKITEWLNCTNKKDENAKQGCTPEPNKDGELVQPAPIYKSQEEEPREIHPLPPKGDLLRKGNHVKISLEDLTKLCEEFGSTKVERTIIEINDYLDSTGKKPYRCYAATIRNWLRRRDSQGYIKSKEPDRRQRYADGKVIENPLEGVF